MRRLLFTLVLLVPWATTAQAQVAFGQFQRDASATPWVTDGIDDLAFDSTVASGSRVCAMIGIHDTARSVSSVTDDGGNTYAVVVTVANVSEQREGWIYCSKTTATMQTVTVTLDAAATPTSSFRIISFTGDNSTASGSLAGAGAVTFSTTTHDTGNVTVAGSGAALFGFTWGSSRTYTCDTDFTQNAGSNTANGTSCYDLTDAGTFSMTTTTDTNAPVGSLLVALESVEAGSSPCTLMLMGVGKCDED